MNLSKYTVLCHGSHFTLNKNSVQICSVSVYVVSHWQRADLDIVQEIGLGSLNTFNLKGEDIPSLRMFLDYIQNVMDKEYQEFLSAEKEDYDMFIKNYKHTEKNLADI